jgi:hypothetical protein
MGNSTVKPLSPISMTATGSFLTVFHEDTADIGVFFY